MALKEIIEKKEIEGVVEIEETPHLLILWFEPDKIMDVIGILRDDSELSFDWLSFLTAIDMKSHLDVIYLLYSTKHKHRICLKTSVKRRHGSIKSIHELFAGAAWHENEVYDMFGLKFEGHPYPRRILTAPGMEGYPLLKDFHSPDFIVSGGVSRKPEKFREK